MSDLRPLVIYHDNCADGFGAAWAAWYKLGDNAEYLPMSYNDKRVEFGNELGAEYLNFPVSLADRNVYILDFSFTAEVMHAIYCECRRSEKMMVVLDHHKTHFEQIGVNSTKIHKYSDRFANVTLDPNHSGCVLAWEHFNPELPTPIGLQLIEDRDLWKWQMGNTRDFATGLRSEPFSFERFNWLMWQPDDAIDAGHAMNKLFDEQLANITARPMPVDLYDIDGNLHMGLATNCTPNFSSEAGNILANQSKTFGMTWVLSQDGNINVSLRSIGDYDVSKIAKNYGGGGHRNAARFKAPFDNIKLFANTIIISK